MPRSSLVPAFLFVLTLAPLAAAQRGSEAARRVSAVENAPSAAALTAVPLTPIEMGRLARPDLYLKSGSRPAILLTGYWPPSNEAIRPYSTDPVQNPGGWQGADWEGRGYDVHAFFPEFSPPTCTSCGKGTGDLEVDYQDTSADFWPIADGLQPIAVMTFSRTGAATSWELEMNQYNRSSWINDYVAPQQPTPAPPDASVPAGTLRLSTLPVNDIVADVAAAGLGLNPFICFSGDGGGFLSEFVAYHGVWYQDLHAFPTDPAWCVAGGHVHVGSQVDWSVANAAVEVSLRSLIEYVDAVVATTICQPDLGFAGPGTGLLEVCGQPLTGGAQADLRLTGGPADQPALLVAGFASNPTPLFGGTLVPVPAAVVVPVTTGAAGSFLVKDVTGPGTSATVFVQALYADPALPQGVGLSNAVGVEMLP